MNTSKVILLNSLEDVWFSKLVKFNTCCYYTLQKAKPVATESIWLITKIQPKLCLIFICIFIFSYIYWSFISFSSFFMRSKKRLEKHESALLDIRHKCCKWCEVPVHCHPGSLMQQQFKGYKPTVVNCQPWLHRRNHNLDTMFRHPGHRDTCGCWATELNASTHG